MNEATRLRQLIDNLLNKADEIDDNGESYLHELIRITHAAACKIPVECDLGQPDNVLDAWDELPECGDLLDGYDGDAL